jgi:SAM-dependent methyltransferase
MEHKLFQFMHSSLHFFGRLSKRFSTSFRLHWNSPFNFLMYMFFDPASIKNKWYREIKRTQLDGSIPLFVDRQNEIKEFFNVDNIYLLKYYLKYGFPNTDRFKIHCLRTLTAENVGPNKLKKAYDDVSFSYTLRLMLSYERYSMISDYLDFMIRDSGKSLDEFKVLDYGCGMADISLFLSYFSAGVTICDLDNERFDYVVSRFRKRGFNPNIIRITDTEIYPNLPSNKFDLVIATELFEHIRDPLKLLKNFTKSLRSGAYLFDSMGGKFERDDRPHHLREAFEIGRSKEYRDFYNNNYKQLFPEGHLRYIFKKR